MKQKTGKVYLVGAGPGDVGLITLRGVEVLRQADVIYYDYLANPQLLSFAPLGCKKNYVGKRGSTFTAQDTIEKKLIEQAKKGKIVVRLKGGDPFIFGRGGEEALALAQAQIPFEVVPGVSSGMAVPAYAGIPLTHRNYSSEIAFVTGHLDPSKDSPVPWIHWERLATIGTLVVFMSAHFLAENAQELIKYGRSPQTPCALISWGTTSRQKTVRGTLETIALEAQKEGVKPPSLWVIGDVVQLKDQLDWFENKLMHSKSILLTRSSSSNEEVAPLFSSLGAQVISFPVVEMAPPTNWKPFDQALLKIKQFDWLVLTSPYGVETFFKRLLHLEQDIRNLAQMKIAVVGKKTADKLKAHGLKADVIGKPETAEGLLALLKKKGMKGKSILLPQGNLAKPGLKEGLKKLGGQVLAPVIYRTECPQVAKRQIEDLLTHTPNWVIFSSASMVRNLFRILGKSRTLHFLHSTRVACIGPVTAKEACKYGLKVSVCPKEASFEAVRKEILKDLQIAV